MHGFSIEAISFLAVIWAFAFASSMARSCTDPSFSSFGRILAFACTSGFVAIGAIGPVCGNPGAVEFNWLLYVGVASLIGGSGKEQDKIVRGTMRAFIVAFKTEAEKPEK